METAAVSARQGRKARRNTMADSLQGREYTCTPLHLSHLRRVAGLRPRQARSRMTTRAVDLVASYQAGSTPSATARPGRFLAAIPVSSIPSSGGSPKIAVSAIL